MDVIEHGPTCIGGVSCVYKSAGEHPYKPCVNGSKKEFSRFGALASSRNVIQNPANLTCREVCVCKKTALLANHGLHARRTAELLYKFGSSPTLPHDSVANGSAGCRIPDQSRFSLVIDAY